MIFWSNNYNANFKLSNNILIRKSESSNFSNINIFII